MSNSVTLWTMARHSPMSVGFSRQEYWSGLPFPSPGDLLDPGIEPRSPVMQADSLVFEPLQGAGAGGAAQMVKSKMTSSQNVIGRGLAHSMLGPHSLHVSCGPDSTPQQQPH